MDGYSFAQLAKSLLGSGQYNANRPELPAEVDYVAYCLRRKHSGGRLDGLAICSGIVAPGHDIPSLALLPQSLVWAVKETNGVLCIEEKGGDAKEYAHFGDLKSALKLGCTNFVASSAPLPNEAGTVSTVVGFKSKAASARASEVAEALLGVATSECVESVLSTICIAEFLLSPPTHFQSDIESDPEEFGISFSGDGDNVSEDEGGESVWDIAGASNSHAYQQRPLEPPPEPSMNPWTLQFDDPALEQLFTTRHARVMLKFDALSYSLLLIFLVLVFFFPGTAFQHASRQTHAVFPVRSLISLAPVALLANRRTREFYVHNRQTLLAFTQLASAQWQLHVQHYMRTMEAATFTRPLYIHGFSWLGVVILLFQYRIRMAAPIAMLCFALDTTLIPQICRIFYQDMGMARCVAGDLARILPLVLLGPLAVAWAVERHARRRVFTTT